MIDPLRAVPGRKKNNFLLFFPKSEIYLNYQLLCRGLRPVFFLYVLIIFFSYFRAEDLVRAGYTFIVVNLIPEFLCSLRRLEGFFVIPIRTVFPFFKSLYG